MNVFAERAKNGIVLTVQDPVDDEMYVWQSSDTDDEYERWQEFLLELTERFGPTEDSRYSPKRIYILVAPGDKWAGNRGCPLKDTVVCPMEEP